MTEQGRDALGRIMEIIGSIFRDAPREKVGEAEERIRAEFGGDEIYVARRPRVNLIARDQNMHKQLLAGKDPADVARQHDISQRQLRRRVRNGGSL